MILAAAALAAASTTLPAPSAGPRVVAQAIVTIRVVTAVRLKLGAAASPGVPATRDVVLRLGNGTTQSARLIEFQ